MIRFKCFHGTSLENGESIIQENHFRPSDTDSLRMGVGAYFFCQAGDDDYPIRCARELEKYHIKQKKHPNQYAILSCTVECEDEEYLDLFNPESLEYFHQMRYILLNKSLTVDPNYKYHNAAVADTQVFDTIRKLRSVSVIRCPQFFGMLEEESRFRFDKGERQFPKTYVPNVIMACIDTNKPIIKDIKLVEKGEMFNGYEEFI